MKMPPVSTATLAPNQPEEGGFPCSACCPHGTAAAAWRTDRSRPVPAPPCVSRRDLVRVATLGVAGAVVVGTTAACGSASGTGAPDREAAGGGEIAVSPADVPPVGGEPYRSEAGEFYLVRNDDGVLAFSWRCTHQGCEVLWKAEERRFHCPCHGSVYDRDGVRVGGPAPRPLDLVRARLLPHGGVAVAPGDVTEREDYDAEQAVPYPASA